MVNSKTIAAMKNLFKNLMFVAVAAMTFASCSKDNEEVNKVEKTTVYNFETTIAEETTRSGFVEKVEDATGATAYKSEWFGGEVLNVIVQSYSDYYVETTATVSKGGGFSLELVDAPESFYVSVFSPAEAFALTGWYTIPAEQTPLANSVDPKAHILNGGAEVYDDETHIKMNHMVGYGKMIIDAGDFAIDYVVLDLFEETPIGIKTHYTYTINADNVVDNTFWFACEPITVSKFTVTAADAQGNMIGKSVDLTTVDKSLSFRKGRVSTFSVSGLEKVATPVFTSAIWTNPGEPENKIVKFHNAEFGTLYLDFFGCNNDNYIDVGTYEFIGYGGIYRDSSYFVDFRGTNYIYSGSVVVDVVDGEYYIEFNNLANHDDSLYFTATFKGEIENLDIPDTRIRLPEPEATSSAERDIVTISWKPVEGADEYYLKCSSPEIEPITTTETSVTIDAEYDRNYEFKLTAVALDTNPNYKSSDPCYIYVRTDTLVEDGLTIETAYTFATYELDKYYGNNLICFSGADNGASLTLLSGDNFGYPIDVQIFDSSKWNWGERCEYSINGEKQEVDLEKSCTCLKGDNYNGYTVEYIYVVTTDGNGIYYKYDGKLSLGEN